MFGAFDWVFSPKGSLAVNVATSLINRLIQRKFRKNEEARFEETVAGVEEGYDSAVGQLDQIQYDLGLGGPLQTEDDIRAAFASGQVNLEEIADALATGDLTEIEEAGRSGQLNGVLSDGTVIEGDWPDEDTARINRLYGNLEDELRGIIDESETTQVTALEESGDSQRLDIDQAVRNAISTINENAISRGTSGNSGAAALQAAAALEGGELQAGVTEEIDRLIAGVKAAADAERGNVTGSIGTATINAIMEEERVDEATALQLALARANLTTQGANAVANIESNATFLPPQPIDLSAFNAYAGQYQAQMAADRAEPEWYETFGGGAALGIGADLGLSLALAPFTGGASLAINPGLLMTSGLIGGTIGSGLSGGGGGATGLNALTPAMMQAMFQPYQSQNGLAGGSYSGGLTPAGSRYPYGHYMNPYQGAPPYAR